MTAPLPPRDIRLAAAAYPVEALSSWDMLAAKLADWVDAAAAEGAEIAVLPEYAGMEAAFALHDRPMTADNAAWCAASAESAGRYAALCATLAQTRSLILLGGSLPARVGRGAGAAFVNRAHLCLPDGRVLSVDKQILTPWERTDMPLQPGPSLPVVETAAGRLAALICYDGEFPPLARAAAPDILLLPSWTEARAGCARLEVAARARALEAQCVTLHAPLIGGVPGGDIADAATGRAGIYGPPDEGFPQDGVLARGDHDTPGWVVATLPEGALSRTRSAGAVAPRAHMGEAAERAALVRDAATPPERP